MGQIDRKMRHIAKMKDKAGEFSLDLYYNDLARPQEAYVALLVMGYDQYSVRKIHFRASNFRKALNLAERYLDKLCR